MSFTQSPVERKRRPHSIRRLLISDQCGNVPLGKSGIRDPNAIAKVGGETNQDQMAEKVGRGEEMAAGRFVVFGFHCGSIKRGLEMLGKKNTGINCSCHSKRMCQDAPAF